MAAEIEQGVSVPRRLWACMLQGTAKGLRTALWLLAIMVPVSLAVTLLDRSGILSWLARCLAPAFRVVGLPGEAAVPFLTGAFLNIYSGIAAMAPLALDSRQITILALAMLISHNLPVEVPIQHKAGVAWGRILALRLTLSALAALTLHAVLPEAAPLAGTGAAAAAEPSGLREVLYAWSVGSLHLIARVCLVVIALMILQQALTEFRLIPPLSAVLAPLLHLLGLPRRTAFLWIVANTLGLAFGAAVILEELDSGTLPPEDVAVLNRSVAICHSLLEDTLLFAAVGAWAFWLVVPRVALAAAVVWLYRAGRAVFAAPG